MHMDDINLFAKNEKEFWSPNTGSENIPSGHRNVLWHRKMHYANNKKSRERHMTDGMELPNQDKIKILR